MTNPEKLFGRLGNKMFQYAYIWSQFRDGKIPDIYVQDYNFFKKHEKEIRMLYGEGIGSIDKISIHIRRGDYVNNSFYVDLSKTDYYQRAIDLFPDDSFLVFSDDPEFARAYFKDEKRFDIAKSYTDVDAMNLMSSCKSNIIANSSFSWWAAFLNPNPNKKIVAPKSWFVDQVQRTKIPPDWILL